MGIKFSIVPADALFDKRITPQHLRTLSIICYYGAQKDSGCWPSYKTLADDIGISKRLVMAYVKHLCDCGYVVREKRIAKAGCNATNIYRVKLDIEINPIDSDAPLHGGSDMGLHEGSDAPLHPLYKNNKREQEKKNIKNKSKKICLADWEKLNGTLHYKMLANWILEKGFDPVKIDSLIERFRISCNSGGNLYVDFRAAFQKWLNEGYFKVDIKTLKVSRGDPKFQIFDRGNQL